MIIVITAKGDYLKFNNADNWNWSTHDNYVEIVGNTGQRPNVKGIFNTNEVAGVFMGECAKVDLDKMHLIGKAKKGEL